MTSQYRNYILFLPIIIKLRVPKGKKRSKATGRKRPIICKEKEPDYKLILKSTKELSVKLDLIGLRGFFVIKI